MQNTKVLQDNPAQALCVYVCACISVKLFVEQPVEQHKQSCRMSGFCEEV